MVITGEDVTMDNPKPSPKEKDIFFSFSMDAVHRLNVSGSIIGLRYSRSCYESNRRNLN